VKLCLRETISLNIGRCLLEFFKKMAHRWSGCE
jgi:hypothetical protein